MLFRSSMIVLVIPTVFHSTVGGEVGDSRVEDLSRIAAVILLLVYALFLLFQFRTHVHLFATDGSHHEEPEMTQRDSVILLVVATVLVSWMAEILVHSVEYAAEDFGLPHLFIGVILLPLFGNAAEHRDQNRKRSGADGVEGRILVGKSFFKFNNSYK